MIREMVVSCLSGTWEGMAQGDLAPERMSSTKLSTVSAQRGRNGKGMRNCDGQDTRRWDPLSENETRKPLGPPSSSIPSKDRTLTRNGLLRLCHS